MYKQALINVDKLIDLISDDILPYEAEHLARWRLYQITETLKRQKRELDNAFETIERAYHCVDNREKILEEYIKRKENEV